MKITKLSENKVSSAIPVGRVHLVGSSRMDWLRVVLQVGGLDMGLIAAALKGLVIWKKEIISQLANSE